MKDIGPPWVISDLNYETTTTTTTRWQDLPADRAHAMPFCGSACAACSTFFARKKSGTRVHIKGTPCGTKLLHSSSRFRTCQGETSKAVDDEKSKKKANNLSQLQVHSDFWQTEKWIAATDMPVPNNTQRDASLKEIKQTLGPRHLKISLGRLGRHGFQNFNHIQPPHTKTPSLGSHPLWVEWACNKRTTIIPTQQLYPSLVFWGSMYICISILNVCSKNVSYWIFSCKFQVAPGQSSRAPARAVLTNSRPSNLSWVGQGHPAN